MSGPLQNQVGHVEVRGIWKALSHQLRSRGGIVPNVFGPIHNGFPHGRHQHDEDQLEQEVPKLQLVLRIGIRL